MFRCIRKTGLNEEDEIKIHTKDRRHEFSLSNFRPVCLLFIFHVYKNIDSFVCTRSHHTATDNQRRSIDLIESYARSNSNGRENDQMSFSRRTTFA